MVFASVPVQGWIINPYKYGFLESSSEVLCLSSNYAEIIYTGVMTCDARMGINWRRIFEESFKSLSKCSCRITNIFLITLYPPITLVTVYHSTFPCDGVFVLGGYKEGLGGIASFEVYLFTMLVAMFLKLPLSPLV